MSDTYSFGSSDDDTIGPPTPLKKFRSKYYEELAQKPQVYRKLMALTQAEVGNQGPEAQQAFLETVFNRAASRGQTLDEAMQLVSKGGYYPGLGDYNKVSAETQTGYGDLLNQVRSGSNVGNYATGNASGTVGFNKGPQVAEYGGERFGVEGPDVNTMQGVAGGTIEEIQASTFDPTGRKRMANGDGAQGILGALGMQNQQPQGLLGALGDPETMAYIGMMLKGLSPYSNIDPNAMLSSAHTNALRKEQLRQQMAERATDNQRADQALKLNEAKFEESKITDAARAAKDQGLEPGTPEYQQYITDYYKKKTGTKFGLNTGYFRDPETGEYVLGTTDDQGNFKKIDTGTLKPVPPGATTKIIGNEAITTSRDGTIIRREPANLGEAAREKEVGAQTGKAQVGLPQALQTADDTIKQIDEIISHPGRETGTGLSSKIDPRNYIPGTDAYNFAVRVKQVGGRAFLQAYETLKGTGQVTEIEGAKATDAIARMDKAQSDQEFLTAMNDFKGVINGIKTNLRKKAGVPEERREVVEVTRAAEMHPRASMDLNNARGQIGRVKRNIGKMTDGGASEGEIDFYINPRARRSTPFVLSKPSRFKPDRAKPVLR